MQIVKDSTNERTKRALRPKLTQNYITGPDVAPKTQHVTNKEAIK